MNAKYGQLAHIQNLSPSEQACFCEALTNIELMLQNLQGGYFHLARKRSHLAAQLLGVIP